MEPENEEVITPEVIVEETPEVLPEEETIDDVKAKLAKAEEIAENQRIRAEKAEKKQEKVVPSQESSELTPKDVYALMNAKVAEEDIEQVADYAKFKKISVAEALKSTVVKTMLEESVEQRTTANATQTRGGARGTSKVSGEDILSQAEKTGELPESTEDIQKLFLARQARRKN